MTHTELSQALALAMGYCPESVRIVPSLREWETRCEVYRITNEWGPYWRPFDYRRSDVCLPLLQYLAIDAGLTNKSLRIRHAPGETNPDVLCAAVAHAVIALKGGK